MTVLLATHATAVSKGTPTTGARSSHHISANNQRTSKGFLVVAQDTNHHYKGFLVVAEDTNHQ